MNVLKPLFEIAMARGVTQETIVLLLLLPLVATFVSAARYLIGIRGLGIFTPVMLAAVLWATGFYPGLFLFLTVMFVATLARLLLKKIKLHYLARMALLFWFICIGALLVLLELQFSLIALLILIFLTQDFIKVQLAKGLRQSLRLSTETLVLGLGGLILLSWRWLQRAAFSQPELTILGTAILNLLIGRFAGLRLLEYQRFKRLLK